MTKLFLDDVRQPYDNTWVVVRSFSEFKKYINSHEVPDIISFDHDLAFEHYEDANSGIQIVGDMNYENPTGYTCAKYLVEKGLFPKQVIVHSWNTYGAQNIAIILKPYCSIIVAPYHVVNKWN